MQGVSMWQGKYLKHYHKEYRVQYYYIYIRMYKSKMHAVKKAGVKK